jgi:hypothetical protein
MQLLGVMMDAQTETVVKRTRGIVVISKGITLAISIQMMLVSMYEY